MNAQERGPEWVARKLREMGLPAVRGTVHHWSTGERRLPDEYVKPLSIIFRVPQKELRS